MSSSLITIMLMAAVLLFWAIGAHNRLVALRNAIGAAWQQIDEPLIRRHQLLHELLAALRGHLPDEQHALDGVLAGNEQVAAAAAAVRRQPPDAGAVATLSLAEQVLAGTLERLRGVLQAALIEDGATQERLAELAVLDQRLAFRRQLFNQAAHRYNAAARQFPTNLLMPVFRFAPAGSL